MAKAKKCDRCGTYFDDNKEYPASGNGYRSVLDGAAFTMKNGGLSTCYDLCDDCITKLKEWLKGE